MIWFIIFMLSGLATLVCVILTLIGLISKKFLIPGQKLAILELVFFIVMFFSGNQMGKSKETEQVLKEEQTTETIMVESTQPSTTLTQTEITTEKESESTIDSTQPSTTAVQTEQTEAPTEETTVPTTSKQVVSDLFENIYVPYANYENATSFESVSTFAEASGYKSEIVEPTDEILGKIKLYDVNGDYVYFSFNPVDGIETIMSVTFYQAETNSEVTMSNYSSDRSPSFTSYDTHIIGNSPVKVNNVNQQRKFLFQ